MEAGILTDKYPVLKWLVDLIIQHKPKRKVRAILTVGPVSYKDVDIPIGEYTQMSFIITIDQQFDVSVAFADSQGNPASVDGIPVWTSSDDSVLAVQASDDGMTAVAAAAGPIGVAQLNVTADADLGAGVVQIVGVLDVQVVSGQAVSAVITPGTPSDKLVVQPVSP